MRKLICFDIDGTLCSSKTHQMSEKTIQALQQLKEKGHYLVIATGRSVDSLIKTGLPQVFPFDGYVCNSGQSILDKDTQIITKESIAPQIVKDVIKIAKANNIPLTLKTKNRFITQKANENVKRGCGYFNNPVPPVGTYTNQEVGAMIAYGPLNYDYHEFKAFECLDVMPGESSYADITIKGISKATGIQILMKQFQLDSYIAFGDSLNDVEMFKHAAYCICMGQGNEELKKMSHEVTKSVDEDGIYYSCLKNNFFM